MKPVSIIIPVYGRDDALATVPFLLRRLLLYFQFFLLTFFFLY